MVLGRSEEDDSSVEVVAWLSGKHQTPLSVAEGTALLGPRIQDWLPVASGCCPVIPERVPELIVSLGQRGHSKSEHSFDGAPIILAPF